MNARKSTWLTIVALATSLGCAHATGSTDAKPDLRGSWVLDAARSEDKVPKAGKSNTGVSVGISGVPVPRPGSSPVGAGSPRDPEVLRAQRFGIDLVDAVVFLRFADGDDLELEPGDVQGQRTKWTGKRLTTSYKTTRRTVSQDYRLTAPDELTVVVKIDPKDERARTYTRVFVRAPAASEPGPPG